MATCDQCHRRSADDLCEWRADIDYYLCGLGAAYAECPDAFEQFDIERDCWRHRDRWQVARIAELEAANAALRAAIEAVREACEAREPQPDPFRIKQNACRHAANDVRDAIAALLPPKGEP